MVSTRPGTPTRRAMAVATASVGDTMAPSATPHANETSSTAEKNQPRARALTSTSTTDRPVIERSSRRKLIVGMDTAEAYSSGGRMPISTHSGSISSSGTPGRKLTTLPTTTSSRGAASRTAPLSRDAPTMQSSPTVSRTTTTSGSMAAGYAASARARRKRPKCGTVKAIRPRSLA